MERIDGRLEVSERKEVRKMKSLFALFSTVVVILGFSLAGFAHTQNSTGNQSKGVTPGKEESIGKALIFKGKVVAVDPADKMIVVKGREGEKTFDVSDVPETFHYGATLHVKYRVENGKMVVLSVKSGMRTVMAGPRYGYDPYYGFDPHFYGYDPYMSGQSSRGGA